MKITEASLALFLELARDAGNWNGSPTVYLTKESRGNLTHLKRAKLVRTVTDEGIVWAEFLPAGGELAKAHGLNIDEYVC